MDINKKVNQGDLGADAGKTKNGKLEINPNQKVKQGELGTAADKPGKKEKVDPSIFRMAGQKDY
jgi:hypothetical protein